MLQQQFNIIEMVGNAGLVVQFVLLLLLFFSVTSWAIILIKIRYFGKAFKESGYFTEFFWKSRDLSNAFVKGSPPSESDGQPLGSRFAATDNVKRALRRAINTEMTRVTQMVPFLATTGNTPPFIGLFGTVWGIMGSFHGIGLKGSANLAVVAPGISEALVATAAGLAVAIPAVIAFNHFTQKVRILESELQSFSADFLNIIERDILRIERRRE
jgi:biopolymer transport protein TolQ